MLRTQLIPPANRQQRGGKQKYGLSLLHLAAKAGSEITAIRSLLQVDRLCSRVWFDNVYLQQNARVTKWGLLLGCAGANTVRTRLCTR